MLLFPHSAMQTANSAKSFLSCVHLVIQIVIIRIHQMLQFQICLHVKMLTDVEATAL